MPRYDVSYHEYGPSIDYHFCREWDEDGGCYGTNESHGLSLDEAIDEIACWHEEQAKLYRSKDHHSIAYFFVDGVEK